MHHDLLDWGQSLNYPTIVLCNAPVDVLRAGRDAWQTLLTSGDEQTLLTSGDDERIARLCARRERWQAICGGVRDEGRLV